jgi:hypothetical protein
MLLNFIYVYSTHFGVVHSFGCHSSPGYTGGYSNFTLTGKSRASPEDFDLNIPNEIGGTINIVLMQPPKRIEQSI